MRSESELNKEGHKLLVSTLGEVDDENFASSIIKEQFDYTKWQKFLWLDKAIDEIHEKATSFSNKTR